jgi:GxxExxY protein
MPFQDELTYKVIGCAMEVHKFLGNGFQEVIYQRCLALELQRTAIQYEREVEQPIFYKGDHVGTRRADFIIEGRIVVELKAVIN